MFWRTPTPEALRQALDPVVAKPGDTILLRPTSALPESVVDALGDHGAKFGVTFIVLDRNTAETWVLRSTGARK